MIYLLLVLAVCAASSAAVLIRLCDAPALVVAAYRLGIAACVVLPLSLMRYGNPLHNVSGQDRLALVSSGVFLGFHFAFWISSLSHTSVASSVLLVTTSPIFLGMGGWLLFQERIDWRTGVGIAVSLVGTGVVTVNDWGIGKHAFSGDVLALGGALAISGHLMIGQRQRQRMNLLPYLAVVNTTAALALLGMAYGAGYSLVGYADKTYGYFLLLALGPQLLGHTTFNYALKRVPPVVIAILLLAEPIGSSVLAYVILGEVPGIALFVGGAIILCGIGMAVWPRRRVQV